MQHVSRARRIARYVAVPMLALTCLIALDLVSRWHSEASTTYTEQARLCQKIESSRKNERWNREVCGDVPDCRKPVLDPSPACPWCENTCESRLYRVSSLWLSPDSTLSGALAKLGGLVEAICVFSLCIGVLWSPVLLLRKSIGRHLKSSVAFLRELSASSADGGKSPGPNVAGAAMATMIALSVSACVIFTANLSLNVKGLRESFASQKGESFAMSDSTLFLLNGAGDSTDNSKELLDLEKRLERQIHVSEMRSEAKMNEGIIARIQATLTNLEAALNRLQFRMEKR